MSVLRWITGDAQSARRFAQTARTMAVALDDRPVHAMANYYPGLAHYLRAAYRVYAQTGRVDEGLALLEQAIAIYEATRAWPFRALLTAHRGAACLRAGRVEAAVALGRAALTLARAHGERGHEAWGRRLLGEIAASTEPPDAKEADRCYRDAATLATELGMRPLVAHCHFGLGTLGLRTRDSARAREHLSTAATMYREMAMDAWLARTEAAPK